MYLMKQPSSNKRCLSVCLIVYHDALFSALVIYNIDSGSGKIADRESEDG